LDAQPFLLAFSHLANIAFKVRLANVLLYRLRYSNTKYSRSADMNDISNELVKQRCVFTF